MLSHSGIRWHDARSPSAARQCANEKHYALQQASLRKQGVGIPHTQPASASQVLRDAHAHSEVTALLSTAYLSFIVSDACGFSGLMTIFFCGVMESHYAKYNISEAGRDTTANTSRVLAYVSETFVFIYFGFIILPTLAASCDHADSYVIDWPFVIWTVLLCIISRACNIIPLTLFLNLFKISPGDLK